jgi:hypothetical protein
MAHGAIGPDEGVFFMDEPPRTETPEPGNEGPQALAGCLDAVAGARRKREALGRGSEVGRDLTFPGGLVKRPPRPPCSGDRREALALALPLG